MKSGCAGACCKSMTRVCARVQVFGEAYVRECQQAEALRAASCENAVRLANTSGGPEGGKASTAKSTAIGERATHVDAKGEAPEEDPTHTPESQKSWTCVPHGGARFVRARTPSGVASSQAGSAECQDRLSPCGHAPVLEHHPLCPGLSAPETSAQWLSQCSAQPRERPISAEKGLRGDQVDEIENTWMDDSILAQIDVLERVQESAGCEKGLEVTPMVRRAWSPPMQSVADVTVSDFQVCERRHVDIVLNGSWLVLITSIASVKSQLSRSRNCGLYCSFFV